MRARHDASVWRSVVQIVRLMLLPFPAAVILSFYSLVVADHVLRPDRSGLEHGGPGEFAGGIAVLFLTVILQALWGAPSLLALDSWRTGLRGYLAAGVASSVGLSLAVATLIRAPQFGETLAWMFSRVLLFFGIPLLLSYVAALFLRTHATRKA